MRLPDHAVTSVATCTGPLSLPSAVRYEDSVMSRSCVVVGAGPAGLSAAYRLANAGVRVTVLEAAPHIGGRTHSERVGEFVLNTGAGFVASFYDRTLPLLRELQVDVFPPREQTAVVATPYGKFPFEIGSPRGLWRFPLLPWIDKLRALGLFARLLAGRQPHIADLASLARVDRGENLDHWGRRTIGGAAHDYLLRGAVESFFYFESEQVSSAIGRAMMRHAVKWQVLFLRGGTGALCEALAQRLEVRTGCAATAVEETETGVAVHHAGGTIEADYAVLTLPATAATRLEGPMAAEDRADLESVRYVPHVLVFFGYERPVTVQYPSVTATGPGRHPVASVWTMSRWIPPYVPEGKELIAIYSSGWRAVELLDREPGRIVAALRADAEHIFGRLADPDWIRVYPRAEATVLPTPGHFRRMQAFASRPRRRILYGGDWLTGSTIEGAVRTGLQAAERILAAQE